MNASPRDIVNQLYAAFGTGDVPGILALLHPDIEWTFNCPNPPVSNGGVWRGHAGATEFFTQVGTHEDLQEFVIDHVIAEGEVVAVRGHERGTHRSTGKHWTTPWIHWFVVRAGLIVKYEGYVDSAQVAAAYAE